MYVCMYVCSGESRISRSGGVHPLGGVDLRCGHFSVKMYAKTKELVPMGGGACAGHAPLDLPMCMNVCMYVCMYVF